MRKPRNDRPTGEVKECGKQSPGAGFSPGDSRGSNKSVLVLESERLSFMRKVIKKVSAEEEAAGACITVLCNRKREKFYRALSRVDRTLTYPGKGISAKIRAGFKLIFSLERYHMTVAVLNGERHFRKSKLLFWLLRAEKRMVFDGHLESFLLGCRTFSKTFSKKRKKIHRARGVEVLLFETDDIEIIREVARITQGDHVIPGARITLFCRESTAEILKSSPLVKRTISYRDNSFFDWIRKAAGAISAGNNVIVGVLNGRKRFFLSKMLFCLCRNRHRLVFNGSLDCCFWNRHTYGQIIVQGLKAGVNNPFARNPRKVLILETAGPETMNRLIRTAADPRVNPDARIILFCNEARLETFRSSPEIERIVTYSDTSSWGKLAASVRIIFSYPDVVVARFSGKGEFRPLKFLFWLVRAPSRLVFNEALDCFYLNRKTAGMMLQGRRKFHFSGYFLFPLLRTVIRGMLFIPRFAYLLAWRALKALRFRMQG